MSSLSAAKSKDNVNEIAQYTNCYLFLNSHHSVILNQIPHVILRKL